MSRALQRLADIERTAKAMVHLYIGGYTHPRVSEDGIWQEFDNAPRDTLNWLLVNADTAFDVRALVGAPFWQQKPGMECNLAIRKYDLEHGRCTYIEQRLWAKYKSRQGMAPPVAGMDAPSPPKEVQERIDVHKTYSDAYGRKPLQSEAAKPFDPFKGFYDHPDTKIESDNGESFEDLVFKENATHPLQRMS